MAFYSALRSNKKVIGGGASLATVGAVAGYLAQSVEADGTHGMLENILSSVKNIESDLGVTKKDNAHYIDPVANFPIITPKHQSLMANVLINRPDLYTKYCNAVTQNGFTFDQAIQAGIDAPHLGVGIAAGDEESYETFKDFMDIIIEGWHGYKPEDMHKIDIDPNNIQLTDEQAEKFDKYVVSTRIRAGRSIRGLPLPPGTNRAQRRKVEKLLRNGLTRMTGKMSGKYYPLGGMTEAEEQQLIDDHFLFQKPSPRNVLANCGAARDWPDGRGIFHNTEKNFLVWVNEEDHMRVISMEQGGNIKKVFARWSEAVSAVESALKAEGYEYMYNDHLGNLCTCPSNLGTGLRASVMLKLPKLYKNWGVHKLEAYCDSLGVQARGAKGEHSPPGPNGEFDISNKARIGKSEVELVQTMVDGVDKLIALEETMP
ncbi:unnamed protein product [Discosporangium mesarthrocarpum]